jgi:DNA processing protein
MESFNQKLLFLHHWNGVSWKMIGQILTTDPTLSTFRHFTVSELKQTGIPLTASKINDLPIHATKQLLKMYEQDGIQPISIFDELYPQVLKEAYQPPWVIYAKGDVALLKQDKKLAVVGSRKATPYGKMAIHLIFPELIKQQYIIVSGLAKGIDTLSHECAMRHEGRTIAVIAGGIHHIYPKENIPLAQKMMGDQLIISEYPPNTRPEKWHFPARNRIISGMCLGTLIIEAEKKSGSLITANYALNDGREVFAVPGNINSPCSFGTNDLILQGAKLVKSAQDIIEEFIF